MNLRWNGAFRRFEAEFTADFQGDLTAVKAAGFKPDTSSGSWVWWTQKAKVLTKLRENKPASGLTITPEARAEYTPLAALEAKNAEIKAEVAKIDKERKKTQKLEKQEVMAATRPMKMCDLGFMCISREDLPASCTPAPTYTPPQPPNLKCIICETPVYFYEHQDPPACLWCELIVLDKCDEVC